MYDYTNSILEFLLTHLSWAYFLLICLQCAQFSHCASSFQNNNNNNNTALESSLDFWFQSIFPDSRKLDDPCTYPNARPSHLKVWAASSSWGVKSKRLEIVPLTHILTQVGWRIQNSTKESSLSEIMTLPLQSRRWSQHWTSGRIHGPSMLKLEDITMLRSTPCNPINNV